MTHASSANAAPAFETDAIPTLSHDMALSDVPQAVTLALDARLAEKQALMALSEDLLMNLRPEIERMTADMVQRILQGVWDRRSRNDQEE